MTMSFTHETLPADPKAAIRQMKQALRPRLAMCRRCSTV